MLANVAANFFAIIPDFPTPIKTTFPLQDCSIFTRVAVSESFLGKGLVKVLFQQIEAYAVSQGIFSIKMDTNFDNLPMLKIAEKLGYVYCGKVYFRGGERLAFEKFIGG